ncbi:hypothetical protein CR194_12820 [Salipaludibacillus keqinensis]|uniref:ATP-grasp domain-containing protein n=1 Tax=Salipaludibacillus keqinensis TaxID=2045207 RepID=A0A323TD37_9BACI|nr:ATP-grasp domain-containing protein [Salipaludibacillus keqinensis]PYZ92546.1 hypothetical protein CR194_12820 [Salipaludibacillus keqinensis]
MVTSQFNWLPHLENAIPYEATQKKISLYTIALEGWRRGLTLKFYSEIDGNHEHQLRYSLASKEREHHFQGSKGDKISNEAQRICDDKYLTNEALKKAGVPIPLGRKFEKEKTDQELVRYAEEIGFPIVLKPTNGSGGKGVIVNITSVDELTRSLQYVRKQLNYEEVIIEQFITGEEFRVYVLNNEVIAAVNRLPANVIGDGKSRISQLIEQKNEERKKVPHLYNRPIKLDKQFYTTTGAMGITLLTIPLKNERVMLKRISNISTGGDPVDVTDTMTEEMKQIAINAANAIPDLPHCGVDMIIDRNRNKGVVIELNTRPGIGSHLFPIEGKARDIPKALIDDYFPESDHEKARRSDVYFPLKEIEYVLRKNYGKEVIVTPAPSEPVVFKKLSVKSTESLKHLKSDLKNRLLSEHHIGFLDMKNDREFEIVLGNPDPNKLQDAVENLRNFIEKGKRVDLTIEPFSGPVSAQFAIIDPHVKKEDDLFHEIEETIAERLKVEKEIQKAKKRLTSIKNSRYLKWVLRKNKRTLLDKK